MAAGTGRPKVAVIGMGGTIAMMPTDAGAIAPAVSPAELMGTIPGLGAVPAEISGIELRRLPSPSIGFGDLAALIEVIDEQLAAGCCGVVVTQGTDSIEETSYALNLRYGADTPVVLTGAMRSPTEAGADGPANLLAAIAVATSSHTQQRGVQVVMADEIHDARWVRKTHSVGLAAFASPVTGPVGYVIEGSARFVAAPGPRMVIPLPATRADPRVCLITMSLGDDGHLLGAVDENVAGVVIAGFGAGHVPAALAERIGGIAARVPTVLTTRVDSGPSTTRIYGYPGSEQDLLGRGLISGGLLHPLKARILLRELLTSSVDTATIAEAFAAAGGCSTDATWPWP